LRVEYDILPDYMSFIIPAFVIQPLVENCFNHGFSENVDVLLIKISGRIEKDCLILRVEDNGKGIPEEVIEAVKKDVVVKRMGVGLTNVNRRLRSIYGQDFVLRFENLHPGAVVEVMIPLEAEHG